MEKTYGGYTVAELREFIAHSGNACESIDAAAGDDGASASIIGDLLDALPSDAAQAPIEYDDVARICAAHGIGLPIDCVEMVVEIVRHAARVAPAAAAPQQVGKNALVLSGAQLLEALDFIAPDRATAPEQLEATVAIEYGEGYSGETTYIWCADYPEEGSFVLDGTSVCAEAAPTAALSAPAPPAPLAAAGLTVEQRVTIQHAADKLRTVWANHTGDKESRELCHKLEAFLAATHGDKQS